MSDITEQLNTALADRYRIERHLGEGGMATVYVAHDLKHDRKVALKVLRPELAAVIGGERFLNEIKVTANLQHPHILPLHDSGEAGSFLYYVMPLVEGDTLREKLDREKQFDIDEAVELTRSVASALDYAHRQGVIHRDVKPENVLIHDGQAMVADFGIALAVSQASGARLTETGLSIGTPHYMSPEQAMGDRELDARSDVYSLGAMLFEMLAGHPPYTGNTAQAIVAKVITEKAPPVTETRDTVPNHVAAAIAKSLQKMPADRFSSAAAFADALTNPRFTVSTVPTAVTPQVEAKPSRMPLVAAVAGVLVALGAGGWLGRVTVQDEPGELARFAIGSLEGVPMVGRCCGRSIAISPEGDRVVFITGGLGGQLYQRQRGRLDAEPINGTAGASIPFFSPDGRWLGFFADGRLRKVPVAGGPPIPIAEASNPNGASWGDNDVIVFSGQDALHAVPAAGGQPTPVVEPLDDVSYYQPFVLPGSRKALFSITGGGVDDIRIGIVDIESGIVDTIGYGTRAEYASDFLVFTGADQTLLAQPFDASSGVTTADAVALLDGVQFRGNFGMPEFALSMRGGLVYQPGGSAGNEELQIVRTTGRESVPLGDVGGGLEGPAFSPAARRIAMRLIGVGESEDIWVFDREQGTLSRLTVEGNNRNAVWTPDGRAVTFSSTRGSVRGIYQKPFDGSGPAELLFSAQYPVDPLSWLPDGRSLVFYADRDRTRDDIGLFRLEDSTVTWLVATEFDEEQAQASPDGRWLAYQSDLSGEEEVYVQAMNGEGARYQVSTAGGESPHWGPDGETLYYVSGSTMIAATVTTEPEFRVTAREELFDGVTDLNSHNVNYDVHPDGEQLLIINQTDRTGGLGIVWILDWPEIVREMVGR